MNKKIDLLVEAGKNVKGISRSEKFTRFGAVITKIKITNEKYANKFEKEKGDYYSLEKLDANYYLTSEINNLSKSFGKLLIDIIKKNKNEYPKKFLVACLGNKNMVCDALAPIIMEKLIITHHIPNHFNLGFADVCAVSPNVMGKTGIESFDVIDGICKKIKPDLLIVVDTLCAENYKRIGKSFQVNFGGVTPGGGVKNFRKKIDKASLNVDVMTIGVPMVVRAETFLKNNNCKIKQKEIEDMVITVSEIEMLNKYCSTIVSRAINIAMHKNIEYKTIVDYMN